MGLRDICDYEFPTLKRGANERCAYGARAKSNRISFDSVRCADFAQDASAKNEFVLAQRESALPGLKANSMRGRVSEA